MYNPPNIELQQQADGSVLLSNIFLGEYYLGFRQLVFKTEDSDAVLCTLTPKSASTIRLTAAAGLEAVEVIADKLGDKRPVAGIGQDCLLKPQKYRVEVWANNGSGRITKANLRVDLAEQKAINDRKS
jgi:hypothetical protein